MTKTIEQIHLVKLFNRLGFKGPDGGLCHGIVMTWISSVTIERESEFWERNNWLFKQIIADTPGDTFRERARAIHNDLKKALEAAGEIDIDDDKLREQTVKLYFEKINKNIEAFETFINKARDSAVLKKGKNLSIEEQQVFELLAFANTVELFLQPDTYHKQGLFESSTELRTLGQKDAAAVSRITQPKPLSDLGGLTEISKKYFIYDNNELQDYFTVLRDYLKSASTKNINIPILIAANKHAVGLRFDIKEDKWLLMDPNHMGEVWVSHDNIVKELKSAFFQENTPYMAFEISQYSSNSKKNEIDELNRSDSNEIKSFTAVQQEIKDAARRVAGTGETMLYYAAKNGDLEFAEALIKEGAISIQANKLYPQHAACAQGYVNIVELFNKYSDRFDLNIAGEAGTLPIDCALDQDQVLVVKELYKIKNDFDKNEHLNTAISKGSYRVVNYLLDIGVKPRAESISLATHNDSPDMFRLLLKHQNINTNQLSLIDAVLTVGCPSEDFLFKESNREMVFGKSVAKLHALDDGLSDTLLEESLSTGTERLTRYLVLKVAADLHKSEYAKDDIVSLKKDLTLSVLNSIYANELSSQINYELLKKIRMMTNDKIDSLGSYIQSLKSPVDSGDLFSNPRNVVLEKLIAKIDDYKKTQANKPNQVNS